MITDRVGDFIIRLQNAAIVGKKDVSVPYSLHLVAIAKKLKELGFIDSVKIEKAEDEKVQRSFAVTLAYNEHGVAKLRGVKRVSKPGRRLYTPFTTAHKVKGGTGALILSSPAGIISDTEARKTRSGGEELFQIW